MLECNKHPKHDQQQQQRVHMRECQPRHNTKSFAAIVKGATAQKHAGALTSSWVRSRLLTLRASAEMLP